MGEKTFPEVYDSIHRFVVVLCLNQKKSVMEEPTYSIFNHPADQLNRTVHPPAVIK